jgi:hypothetical protein
LVDGRPVQAIADGRPVTLRLDDLSGTPEPKRRQESERRVVEEAGRPFELSAGPVLRALRLHLGRDEHLFLLTIHRIACDGWSIGILFEELAALYEAHRKGDPFRLPEPPLRYADFARWQRQWFQGKYLSHICPTGSSTSPGHRDGWLCLRTIGAWPVSLVRNRTADPLMKTSTISFLRLSKMPIA